MGHDKDCGTRMLSRHGTAGVTGSGHHTRNIMSCYHTTVYMLSLSECTRC